MILYITDAAMQRWCYHTAVIPYTEKKTPHYVPSPWTQAAAVLNPQDMQQRGNKANIPRGKLSVMGKCQCGSPELGWV